MFILLHELVSNKLSQLVKGHCVLIHLVHGGGQGQTSSSCSLQIAQLPWNNTTMNFFHFIYHLKCF